jgi:hypothetical protein
MIRQLKITTPSSSDPGKIRTERQEPDSSSFEWHANGEQKNDKTEKEHPH